MEVVMNERWSGCADRVKVWYWMILSFMYDEFPAKNLIVRVLVQETRRRMRLFIDGN